MIANNVIRLPFVVLLECLVNLRCRGRGSSNSKCNIWSILFLYRNQIYLFL